MKERGGTENQNICIENHPNLNGRVLGRNTLHTLVASMKTMGIMINYLYTLPLYNFGIVFSHTICVIVKYFGRSLLKPASNP